MLHLSVLISLICCPLFQCYKMAVYVNKEEGNDSYMCLSGFLGYPCRTLNYACHNGLVETGSEVILSYGLQITEMDILIKNVADVFFIGNETIVNCSMYGTGLTFVNVTNIYIAGIAFQNCGTLHNSTRVAYHQDSSVMQAVLFRSAIYIFNSTNVRIMNAAFTENIGTGLVVINAKRNVLITSVNFSRNLVPTHEQKDYPGGGGLYIEFVTCSPGIVAENNNNPYVNNNKYKLVNCVFQNNVATSIIAVTYLKRNGPILNLFGAGGGLRISLKGVSRNNEFLINNCTFLNNSAVFGGGMTIDIEGESSNNTFYINAILENNTAREGGGGFDFGIFSKTALKQNSFIVNSSRFSFNHAEYGGGSRFYSARSPYSSPYVPVVLFHDCLWEYNVAAVGAAVALFPEAWEISSAGYLPLPHFNNCHFVHNSLSSFLHNNVSKIRGGSGVLISDTMSVNFSGSSSFYNNSGGSCIHISAAEINVLPNALVEFCENSAQKGGAITLMGYSYIVAFEYSTLLFLNNKVHDRGGAIFSYNIDSQEYLNSRKCFFQYYELIPVHEWKVNFTFINNTADTYGHSIYATSLESCARANFNMSADLDITDMFHWSTFFFTPSLNSMKHIITTDPANITVQSGDHRSTPGSAYQLPIQIVDDLNQEMNFVLVAICKEPSSSIVYVTDKFITLTGRSNSSVLISLETSSDSRQVGVDIVVHLTECTPGYYWTEAGNCQCIASSQHKLLGIFACNQTSRRAYLRVGYWAGCLYGSHGPLVTAKCPLGYCNYQSNGHQTMQNSLLLLPSNCSDLEEFVCSHGKRRGVICGECISDYSVYFHSDRYKCDKCFYSNYGIFFYALSELLPLTLLFCLIICFDVSLTSGGVSSFVFFAQVLDICEVSAYGTDNFPNVNKSFSRV